VAMKWIPLTPNSWIGTIFYMGTFLINLLLGHAVTVTSQGRLRWTPRHIMSAWTVEGNWIFAKRMASS
jgi:hypothetical protein